MITVAYSTRKIDPNYNLEIKKAFNIKDLNIVPYENENGQYSLTELYNEVLEESKDDIIVFMHDDLIFNTDNIGKKLISHFNSSDYGILGIAGTTDLISGRWWDLSQRMVGIVNHKHQGKVFESKYSNNFGTEIIPVVVLDGLFLAVKKSRLKADFDLDFKGFHFYDIGFSAANHIQGVKLGCIFDIRITHLSIGETNDKWEENKLLFEAKYRDKLPLAIKPEKIYYNTKQVKIKENKQPKLAIIIPHKDNNEMLFNCIDSLLKSTQYNDYKIFIADTGSSTEKKNEIRLKYKNYLEVDNFQLIEYDYYNYSKINNDVVKNHVSKDYEILLFLNNDIIFLSDNDCITRMVQTYINNKNVGTIGARLYFEDNSIQHSSVSVFIVNRTQFSLGHHGFRSYYNYYDYTKQDVFGNTFACALTPRRVFDKIGGLNEKYTTCFEDVEYNASCIIQGFKNIFCGEAVAYHLESQTRKKENSKQEEENKDMGEILLPFVQKHGKILEPYFKHMN